MALLTYPGFLIVFSVFLAVEGKTNCNETYKNLEVCWDWHHILPTDCNKTSLVKCSGIEEYNLRECDDYWKTRAEHQTKLYSSAMNIVCKDKDLYTVFQREEDCWRDARSCVIHIIRLPKSPGERDCLNLTSLVNDCKSHEHSPHRTHTCSAVLEKYADSLLRETVCGAANLLVHLVVFVTSTIVALVISNM